MAGPSARRNGLLIGLSIAFSALTLTTIGFGISTIALLAGRGAAITQTDPSPSATPTAQPGQFSTTIDGFEITSTSDFTVERVVLAVESYSGRAVLYAFLTNEDDARAADTFFDVTAYREDGSIVDRELDAVYAPSGETSVLRAELPEDLDEVVTISIEQTSIEWLAAGVTGDVTVDSVTDPDFGGLLEVQLTSGLSGAVEHADVYLVAYDDKDLVGVCKLWTDIPASGSPFEGLCEWSPAAVDDPVMTGSFPDDLEYEAYVRMDAPE